MSTATNLIDIATLTLDDVRLAVEEALASSRSTDAIADYVASVDWSRAVAADAVVRDRLGRLEQLATSFTEGDLQLPEFRKSVRATVSP